MSPAPMRDLIVLDLECAHSPDDCRYCGKGRAQHMAGVMVCPTEDPLAPDPAYAYTALGWNNKPALGLSLGAYYSYARRRLVWFDVPTLEDTVRFLVDTQPGLVSFNGIGFDFVVMRGLLRRQAEVLFNTGEPEDHARAAALHALCDAFKEHCARSYDLLATIWASDPASQRVRGVNGLDALCQANGISGKTLASADMPGLWQAGAVATVANHCAADIYMTLELFELAMAQGSLERTGAPRVTLLHPTADLPTAWLPAGLSTPDPVPVAEGVTAL